MSRRGTIYIDFDCINENYRITTMESLEMVRYALDKDRSVKRLLLEAVDRAYPFTPWCTGMTQYHRLCEWLFWSEPDLKRLPNSQIVLDELDRLRVGIVAAYEKREFRNHYYSDFPKAAEMWIDQSFEVVSFSGRRSEDEQLEILKKAAPDCDVRPVSMGSGVGTNSHLGGLHSIGLLEVATCILILDSRNQASTIPSSVTRRKTIIVERHYKIEPHLEKGYYYAVGTLLDIDPLVELGRNYG